MRDRIYDAFDSVKASEKIKTSTKLAMQKERNKKTGFFVRNAKWIAACIAFFLILGTGGYYGVSAYPTSYLSIDINPSIELSLNCWSRVIRATPYNDDGKKILDEISLEGMKLEDALDALMESDAMAPYLSSAKALDFTVAADSAGKKEQITETIDHCSRRFGHRMSSYYANVESISEAHDCGMSFGKYNAYLELNACDESVTKEACDHMSVSEMHDLAHKHKHEHQHREGGHHSEV